MFVFVIVPSIVVGSLGATVPMPPNRTFVSDLFIATHYEPCVEPLKNQEDILHVPLCMIGLNH